ncbi:oligopeptide ABC transporter permease [Enterococcus saccharolyticus]|uniref:ABC transporter permease n=1 Tax=Enterococcus saccharolyticus subsp. saccharolyticus ATCC 43076 TaxID=1139996 RepID=S0J069_9ENTE|nr:oligopeptide ABC transporter permease [Enterococcus saccharolyticus]EOT25612.1 ABC transporter permease [Enterococcus saccharolyticus subsp. saccharolyticus ATCC 43076]EOT83278.1 ABC transporter permease [Enterococcus saccharolyticus subsp. saccharolyticus ATCC 43076]OJG90621.1 ABC transporter permease [Enterococcus saccharolyticus]
MWKTILRRLILMIPQVIILSLLIFVLAKMMPGDPFTGLIDPSTDPARLEELRQAAGFYDPWYVQYFRWINNALHGDFGISYMYKYDVTTVIGQRIGNTVRLSIISVILTYVLAIPLGLYAGRYQNSWFDKTVVVYNFISFAVPTFVLALLMVYVFGFKLGWFPTSGSVSINAVPGTIGYFMSQMYHVILPAIVQALLGTAVTIQYLRSEVIDAKQMDYVRTARSKGVPTGKVFNRHIFRNASLPIASILGYEITGLIAGSVMIEQIFSYPGIGNLFISSINQRDYSVITALILLFGLATLIGTLLSDIIMSIVNPRIRVQ